MIRWIDAYDLVMPELPGIHVSLVDLHLRMISIELCRDTQVWIETLDPIDVVANTATYALNTPAAVDDAAIAMVKWAWYGTRPITFSTLEELGQLSSYWPDDTANEPTNYTQQAQDTLTLYPKPLLASTGALKMKAALMPSLNATGIPDWIGQKYIQDIAFGTKAVLMAMFGKPWSNPDGSVYYRNLFEASKTKATIDSNRSFTRANSQIQMRSL